MQNADKKNKLWVPILNYLIQKIVELPKLMIIAKELTNLWKSLNFLIVSHQQVQSKTRSVVDLYEKYRKRKSEQVEKELKGPFDITKVDGN